MRILLTLFLGGCLLASCKKDSPGFEKNEGVFIAGSESGHNDEDASPVFWKNGVPTVLRTDSVNGYAEAITVSGNDVYVVGWERKYGYSKAVMWKNGTKTVLSSGSNDARAYDVVVSGNDVYTLIEENINPRSIARVLKNGVATDLLDGNNRTIPGSLFVDAGNVYVAGDAYNSSLRAYQALVWKNGVSTILPKSKNIGNISCMTSSIFVVGEDVYIAGKELEDFPNRNRPQARLWKNGSIAVLPASIQPSSANSVFVAGSDVYVAGSAGDKAILWKNGQEMVLAEGTGSFSAQDVYVKGNDVYVLIQETPKRVGAIGFPLIKIWKNGQISEITKGDRVSACNKFIVK